MKFSDVVCIRALRALIYRYKGNSVSLINPCINFIKLIFGYPNTFPESEPLGSDWARISAFGRNWAQKFLWNFSGSKRVWALINPNFIQSNLPQGKFLSFGDETPFLYKRKGVQR